MRLEKPTQKKRRRYTAPSRKAQQIKAAQNRTQALQMKALRMTYEEIGIKLGVSTQRAYQYVEEALAEMSDDRQELARWYMKVHLKRLELMDRGLAARSIGPNADLAAIDRSLAIIDREARLLGEYAPTKVAQTNGEGNDLPTDDQLTDAELADALTRAAASLRQEDGGDPDPGGIMPDLIPQSAES